MATKKCLVFSNKYPMANGQYIGDPQEKSLIILHHTAGTTAKGAINWWNQTRDRVGTPWVIDRDGTTYKTFGDDDWAYHLGVTGDDDWIEKASVGIEIVSAGRLYKEDRGFIFYPLGKNNPKVFTVIAKEEVIEITGNKRWDGFWHKFTDAQITSVVDLITDILERHPKIKLQKDFTVKTLDYDSKVITEKKTGIFSHSTIRKDKVDIFPQPNLIKAISTLIKA